jgi:hypothetical protein
MPVDTKIQIRRGYSDVYAGSVPAGQSKWSGVNPVLAQGELGYEIDTNRVKIGDGLTAWNGLSYASNSPDDEFHYGVSGIGVDFPNDEVRIAVTGIEHSQVNDWDDAVSGILPSFTGADGVVVVFSGEENQYYVSLEDPEIGTGNIVGFEEAVRDVVGTDAGGAGFLRNGYGIDMNYVDLQDSVTISFSGTALTGVLDVTATATEVNYLAGSIPGRVLANKAVVADASRNIGNVNDLSVGNDLRVTGVTTLVGGVNVTGVVSTTTIEAPVITATDRFVGSLSGTANVATNVTVDNDGSTSTLYLAGVEGTSDGNKPVLTDSQLNFVTSTNTLNSTNVTASSTATASDVQTTTLTAAGTATFNGDVDLGDNASDTVTFTSRVDSSIVPSVTQSNDLGTSALEWDTVYAKTLEVSEHINVDGNIDVGGFVVTTGSVTINGDLTVNGDTTTINSEVKVLEDPIILLGGTGEITSNDGKDRGVAGRYYQASTSPTGSFVFFGWDNSTNKFTYIPDATFTNEVAAGAIGELDANIDFDKILNAPNPNVSVTLAGDVTGTANADITALTGDVALTITTTIENNSIVLGDDTEGQYAQTLAVAGNGLSCTTPAADDGTDYTVTSNATAANTASTIVYRDANRAFSAQTITVNGLVNVATISGVSAAAPVVISYAVIDGGSP